MTDIKFIVITVLVVISFGLGYGSAWSIQSGRVAAANDEKAASALNLSLCRDANAASEKTISIITKDAKSNIAICSARLRIREALFAKVKNIQFVACSSTGTLAEVKNDEATPDPDAVDPLLDSLNGMYDGPGARKP